MKNSIWQYKPWWCQPWSIGLTSIVLISGSWILLHRVWLTALVAIPVLTWMVFFLLIYPRLMQEVLTAEPNQPLTPTDPQPPTPNL